MSDFFMGRSSVTSRIENVDSLEFPTLTFCMTPSQKTSVAEKYGFTEHFDIASKEVPNTTYGERMTHLSYHLNKDYEIHLNMKNTTTYQNGSEMVKLKEGHITLGGVNLEVRSIKGLHLGTCTTIKPMFQVTYVPIIMFLKIRLNPELSESDKPEKFRLYLTGNKTWHGVTTVDWPQFKPSLVEFDFKENSSDMYYLQLTSILHLYDEGVESTEDCWFEEIMGSNCTSKCTFGSFVELPTCKTTQEVRCIRGLGESGVYSKCSKKKRGLSFNIERYHYKKYADADWISLDIGIYEMTKEIREEVDVITMPELIGSVGGSLGMFFGFSISSYVLVLIDKLFHHFNNQ